MTLRELVAALPSQANGGTIFAAGGHEAGSDSDAWVVSQSIDDPGTDYVLEIDTAKEVLGVWSQWRDGRQPTPDEACEAILHYARFDAYLPID